MATFKVKQDTSEKRQDLFPFKLCVTHQRRTIKYQTIHNLSLADAAIVFDPVAGAHLANVRKDLNTIEVMARHALEEMGNFNFDDFEQDHITGNPLFIPRRAKAAEQPDAKTADQEKDFDFEPYHKRFPILKEAPGVPGRILHFYIAAIKTLLIGRKVGSALTYQDSYYSLHRFRGNSRFKEIDVLFLMQFENWMKDKGCNRSTIGIKLRPLRAVFNLANDKGAIDKSKCYPFGRRRYKIPTSRNIKKALTIEQLKTLYFYKPDCPNECRALKLWFFLFFGNGMNVKDMVYLQYKDIQDDEFIYLVRAKTINTKDDNALPIVMHMNADMKNIIEKYGNPDRSPDNYIFPFMNDDIFIVEQHYVVRAAVKFINDRMARIGKRLGIPKKVTTITSRHSFATYLKMMGASIEYIKEALGHSSVYITERYLANFDLELKKKFSMQMNQFSLHANFLTSEQRLIELLLSKAA